MTARAILHVDMDAFYASVEVRDDPRLAGKPVIVGGTGNRGVVAAASYEVRKYGVRSAMPMRDALRRCPQAVCIRPRMARYAQVSRQVFGIFHEFTPEVEGLSLDEAFLDVTASQRLLGPAENIARRIKSQIVARTGLTASVGLAPNKLLAKIASDLNKPDGFCRIDADNLRAVLDPLPIGRLGGIGPKTLPRVQSAGIHTFGDLRAAADDTLRRLFGKEATLVRARACGIDARPVVADRDEKSISSEETFDIDLHSPAELNTHLTRLADKTASRLRAAQLTARVVVVKVRRADFTTHTRRHSFEPPTTDTALIIEMARRLLAAWRDEYPDWPVRLLGVGVSQLAPTAQGELFGAGSVQTSRQDAAIDAIRQRFGSQGIMRGGLLPARSEARTRRGGA
ncbi:MAG: DNA polymerase IV [Proteobacteria bacterium]|nr:DNA polymerase IV [Pseudomonadota bacterium]